MISTPSPVDKSFESIFGEKEPKDFHWTIWPARRPPEYKHVAFGGQVRPLVWESFVCWVELEHGPSGGIYPKGQGPYWEPVTNPTGHRTNETTDAMHAICVDCDGAGDWDQVLAKLDTMGVKYVAHRSTNHKPSLPKWRLIVPFDRPFATNVDRKASNLAWHEVYLYLCGVFGELAGFSKPWGVGGEGKAERFDHACKPISQAFYLGHRAAVDEPCREVRVGKGNKVIVLDELLPLVALRDGNNDGGDSDHDPEGFPSFGEGSHRPHGPLRGAPRPCAKATKWLGSDYPVDITGVGLVPLGSAPKGHCKCPEHGGKGKGTAYVVPASSRGRGLLVCTKCDKHWKVSALSCKELEEQEANSLDGVELISAIESVLDLPLPIGTTSTPASLSTVEGSGYPEEGRREGLSEAVVAEARAAGAGAVVERARRLYGDVEDALVALGMPKVTSVSCGFHQLLSGSSLLVHYRMCRGMSCTHCASRRVGLKLTAIAHMPFTSAKKGMVGPSFDERVQNGMGVWVCDYIPETETKAVLRSLETALKANISEEGDFPLKGSVKGCYSGNSPSSSAPLGGWVLIPSADGSKGFVVTTVHPTHSRVWASRFTPLAPCLTARGQRLAEWLWAKVQSNETFGLAPSDQLDEDLQPVVPERPTAWFRPKATQTLSLDPETIHSRASQSGFKVVARDPLAPAAAHAAWKAAGAAGTYHEGDAKRRSPGYARTRPLTQNDDRDHLVAVACGKLALPAPAQIDDAAFNAALEPEAPEAEETEMKTNAGMAEFDLRSSNGQWSKVYFSRAEADRVIAYMFPDGNYDPTYWEHVDMVRNLLVYEAKNGRVADLAAKAESEGEANDV